MRKIEYDFLTWTSFPSSLKLVNDEERWFWVTISPWLKVNPGSKISVAINVKAERNAPTPARPAPGKASYIWIHDNVERKDRLHIWLPIGPFEWSSFKGSFTVPSGIDYVEAGLGVSLATLWIDDFKVYQDDKLIYDNYFTALRPGKVVPVIWTPPERIIGAVQRLKQGEKALIFKPPRLLQTTKV